MENGLYLTKETIQRLLAAGDGDAALYYLWSKSDRAMPCPLCGDRLEQAKTTLGRLGLCEQDQKPLQRDCCPVYTEQAVTENLQDQGFSCLVGQAQRLLGRILSTEELKCLLSIHEYLRLPGEVVSVLISYCIQRNRARGVRAPSMRNIEKEAYRWSDEGIDTMDAAVLYVQQQLARQSRHGRIAAILQVSGRRLTQGEESYVNQWLEWGFPDDAIRLAYEKTCLNTGGLRWQYLHSILKSWHEKGLHSLKQIREGDGGAKKPAEQRRAVSDFERDAVRKLMERQEG